METFKFSLELLALSVFLATFTSVLTSADADSRSVYYSNFTTIGVFANNTTHVLFEDPSQTGDVGCNPNPRDERIYWIDLESESDRRPLIKSGIPGNLSSVETVISTDLISPMGLAVDWAASNIYFSQHRAADNQGRIEVASSDGSKRRVLLTNLYRPGSLAVNILTGYLYYTQDIDIHRCHLDGSNTELVYSAFAFHLNGISVDVVQNVLYWTADDRVYKLSIAEFEGRDPAASVEDLVEELETIGPHTNLYAVSAFNHSLYYTVRYDLRIPDNTVLHPGALYHTRMEGDELREELLAEGENLNPMGVCTFYNVSAMSSPCYNASSVCQSDAFCFTVPNSQGGVKGKCECPTGLMLNADNTSCSDVPQNFLIYTQVFSSTMNFATSHTELRMISLDQSPPFIDTLLPVELPSTEAIFVAYDFIQHRVYWTELHPPSIMRAYINGTEVEAFINTSISQPESLAVDPFSMNLYWADSRLDRISVARLDNPTIRRVLFDNIRQPQGLALDVRNGLMYWSDLDQLMPVVERANMDGTSRTQISRHNIETPTNVAVDPLTGVVYWNEFTSDPSPRSQITKFEGGGEQYLTINSPPLRQVLGLAVIGDHIYWTDRDNTPRSMGRAEKRIGMDPTALLSSSFGLGGIVAVNTTARIEDATCSISGSSLLGACQHLCLPSAAADSGHTCACADNFVLGEHGVCDDIPPRIFVANSTYITELDTSNQNSFGISHTTVQLPSAVAPQAMDMDLRENTIYWIDNVEKTILRYNLLTSSQETVVSCCLSSPEDLAVDWLGRNLYWTDSERGVIEVSTLSGEARTIVGVVPRDVGRPSRIALDPHAGYIYWSSKTEAKIFATKMNGNMADSVLVTQFNPVSASIFALALNFSISGSVQLYWGVDTGVEGSNERYRILRSDLPSGDPIDLQGGDTLHYQSIRSQRTEIFNVLLYGGHIVYSALFPGGTDATFIYRIEDIFDLHNNAIFSFISFDVFDFTLAHHTTQPGDHVCELHECGGETLCLVNDGVTGSCQCSPRSLSLSTGDDHINCHETDTFLILATENLLHYLPVGRAPNDRGVVSALPSLPKGRVRDVAYDPFNERVLWVERGSNVVRSFDLDDEVEGQIQLVQSNDSVDPFSLAYDWRGGHVVITEFDRFQLQLVTEDGQGRGNLLDLARGATRLEQPRDVVFDSEASTLYWTERDGLNSYSRGLKYLRLSDIQDISTIPLNNTKISKLTLEPHSNSLCWVAHDTDSGEASIQLYSIVSGTVKTIATNAENVEALAATSVEEALEGSNIISYVYWYNRTDQYIYVYNSSNGAVGPYVHWRTDDTVVSMVAHRHTLMPSQLACLAEQRPCSHICVPGLTSNDFTCDCPYYTSLNQSSGICTSYNCTPGLQVPCEDGFGTCIARVYFCDGITHCRNALDEQCECDLTTENGCYNGGGCYSRSERCDGVSQCPNDEDEDDCCDGEDMFGCFSNNSGIYAYSCHYSLARCDSIVDCDDGSDERDCDTTVTTSSTSDGPTPSGRNNTIIIATVIVVVLILVLVVTLFGYFAFMCNKKRKCRVGHNHHSIYLPTNSPQPQTDSQSDYNSEFSHNTNTTQVGNGSALSPCADKAAANLNNGGHSHIMNPPPSPISTIQMQPRHSLALSDDGMSTFSHGYSEYNPPAPPCPSLNYDNVSGMSFSVSQMQFPATINASNNYHHHQYPGGGGGGRPPGRNTNPLHARNPHPAAAAEGGYHGQLRGGACAAHQQYYSSYHHSCHTHPDITELDSIAQTETDSTMSITTENPYDQDMPHLQLPPPGRPNSPATMYSEYPACPPLSPRSSTASYTSEV